MKKLKYHYLILLLILISCTPKYDVELTEISFSHDEEIDIINYQVYNPTNENLSCELEINLEEEESVTDNFEINAFEEINMTTRAKLPFGETRVMLKTRCKPIN
ncbi:MAG: hypothetical protein KKF89_00620 [Nanoarchaeota archaeon]|nr:hypothetical protein [Nanoarchaeota archaeon]